MLKSRGNGAHDFQRLAVELCGVDPYAVDVAHTANALAPLGRDGRKTLLAAALRLLEDGESWKQEILRVSAVKVLISLIPESWDVVRRLLSEKNRSGAYEIQFTLFCFLDAVRQWPLAQHVAREVPRLVGEYLKGIRSEAGMAAWMAGELLGEHWDDEESLQCLIEAARRGRFVAGRKGAVHGLGHRIANASGSTRKRLESVLKHVETTDRSEAVRKYTKSVQTNGCARWV